MAHKKLAYLFSLLGIFIIFPPAALSQSSQVCLACHGNRDLTMTKGGQVKSLYVDEELLKQSVHLPFSCPDCHRGLNGNQIPHAKVIKPVRCQNCHETPGFGKSIHGMGGEESPIAGCVTCHGSHDMKPVKDANSVVSRMKVSGTCGKCHPEEFRQFAASAHGGAASKDKQSPTCIGCHSAHNAVPSSDPQSPVFKTKESGLCLKCHLENSAIRDKVGYSSSFMLGYRKSVHGKALASGNMKSATCSSCHGSHDLKKSSDPASLVSRGRTASTCGHCHGEIAKVYQESIHGTALQKGNADSPTCTNCHGEHEILGPKDRNSPVSPLNVSVQVCGRCHNSVPLNQKYGMPSQQFNSFQDSFHGLAGRAGSVEVANCASCHGVHNIRPSSDTKSTVNKANLAATCGRCHPGAGENFTKGAVHVVIGPSSGPAVLYWIRALYIFLIVTTIGAMFIHNFLDFIQKTRYRFAVREGKIAVHPGAGMYIRMSLNDRIQHAVLFSSFIILAVTGFMLKYPDAWWVIPIRQLSGSFFVVRSILHRIAGAVLIGISLYHVLYIIAAKRGRQFLRDITPKPEDVTGFWKNLRYLLWSSKEKPLFGRFSYIEKAEYWALVWGVVVMSATGIIMWFDNFFIGHLTKLGWDVSRTIHFYEACLAALAIVVWHFYFVILNPSVYPMSTAWITGKISEHEMEEDHPLELEQIKKLRSTNDE